MPYPSPLEDRFLRAESVEHYRQWQAGLRAVLREHRRLVVVGTVVAAVALLRRHIHPLVALLWGVLLVVAVSPVLVIALAVEVTRREHRRFRSGRRTVALAANWAAGTALAYGALVLLAPWLLLPIPVAAAAWMIDGYWRKRLALSRPAGPASEPLPGPEPPEP